MNINEILRGLPQVDFLLRQLGDQSGNNLAVAREVLDGLRQQILAGEITEIPDFDAIAAMIAEINAKSAVFGLRRVINATGVVLHTNLGRAPLPRSVAEHVAQVAMGYCNLEYDLQMGSRGSRMDAVKDRLIKLCGAEAAVCVNNNAAAVLLVLSALCAGTGVVVSRGELVEIGGSFRIPDIVMQGGARLVEVGTTNKTRLADYQAAMTEDVGAILKVHTSNYRIMGFTQEVELHELAKLAQTLEIPLVYDLGGGALIELSRYEPIVQEVMSQGVDVLCFSGDKLLGGPQCGIILGKKEYIDKIAKHPLYRALRMDKLTLAALEATLMKYQEGKLDEIPVLRALRQKKEELKESAEQLLKLIEPVAEIFTASVIEADGQAGGGSLPTEAFPSFAVAISTEIMPLQELERRLRQWHTPIVARIHREQLLLDVRTISREDFAMVAAAVQAAFGEVGGH